jgi:hypothetical protein
MPTTGRFLNLKNQGTRMSFDGGARNDKARGRPGSHAKEGNSFKITTLIVIPLLAIVVPAIVAIYIAKTSGSAAVDQPRNSAPLNSQPSGPPPTAAKSKAVASASASTSDPASSGNTDGVTGQPMYTQAITLNGHGCTNTYIFQVSLFQLHKATVSSTSQPPSNTFGVDLFCAPDTNGGRFDPNIQYGGTGAFVLGRPDFDSCYSKIMNSSMDNKIQFTDRDLHDGAQLCILNYDGNELALVTLTSVDKTEYLVRGTVVLWRVLTSS